MLALNEFSFEWLVLQKMISISFKFFGNTSNCLSTFSPIEKFVQNQCFGYKHTVSGKL